MAASPRRKTVAVQVGGVKVGGEQPDCGAVDDEHRYGRCLGDRESGHGAGSGRFRTRARHG